MKKILITILCLLSNICSVFAQNNYSIPAIDTYNSGVTFQKQKQYEQAEIKYNQALKIQPNLVEAKKNLSIIYYIKAQMFYSADNYIQSLNFAQKAFSYGYNKVECYYLIARCYNNLGDINKSELMYNKILKENPNDDCAMNELAIMYFKSGQNEKSSDMYKKVLSVNPNDTTAQSNLKNITYYQNEKKLTDSINNLPIVAHAPISLYRLIKPSPGITDIIVFRTKSILDLIWSDSSGRILLQELLKNKVKINITQGAVTANTLNQTKQNTFMLYGFIPVFSYNSSSLSVNISFNYISDFYDPNVSSKQRIYDLQVFFHEFGHAFMLCKSKNHQNSLEEELGVSMLGFNSAYKIITGQYLTREQTKEYGLDILQSLLNDDHNRLPVHGDFSSKIQSYKLYLPYPEIYANIPAVYNKLRKEGKVPFLSNFNIYYR